MSQPLWFLRHAERVIGPFPAPQVREFLRNGEITQDWEISLDEVDWLSIRDSGQFEEDAASWTGAPGQSVQDWREQREQARHRWLQDTQDIEQTEAHDLALERRARQALAEHQTHTDSMLRAAHGRRPPIIAGLLAVLVLLVALYFIWRGQGEESAIQAGIGLRANCALSAGEAVNWSRCDKRGLSAPGIIARNMVLLEANLEGADLEGADLSYGALVRANLRNANLRGVRLTGADLSGADLGGADLRTADLRYAVLKGARLEGARLEGAALGKSTWPDGRLCPEGALGQCP